jgi:hypothetical protein
MSRGLGDVYKRQDKAFRELDYEAFTTLCKLLEDFDKIKMAYEKGDKINV